MKFQHIYVVYPVTIDEGSVWPTLSYMTIDDAALNTTICQRHNASKYQLTKCLVVCSQCTHQTDILRNSNVYIDHCISSVTYLYQLLNILPDPISRIAQDVSVSDHIHYLDDNLTIEPLLSPVCQHNFDIFTTL